MLTIEVKGVCGCPFQQVDHFESNGSVDYVVECGILKALGKKDTDCWGFGELDCILRANKEIKVAWKG